MKYKDLVGKNIVGMADGAQVGKVKDLLFDGLDLTALVVRGEKGEGLLPFKSLGANGPDAIMIESFTLVDWNPGRALDPTSSDIHELCKLDVIDAEGHMLGHIHDLTLDDTGHVIDIQVRTQGVFGVGSQETVIPGSRIRAVGPKLITVEAVPVA